MAPLCAVAWLFSTDPKITWTTPTKWKEVIYIIPTRRVVTVVRHFCHSMLNIHQFCWWQWLFYFIQFDVLKSRNIIPVPMATFIKYWIFHRVTVSVNSAHNQVDNFGPYTLRTQVGTGQAPSSLPCLRQTGQQWFKTSTCCVKTTSRHVRMMRLSSLAKNLCRGLPGSLVFRRELL